MTKITILASTALVALAASATVSFAQGKVTLYCSAQEDWCQVMARGFEEETGIKVNMTRKSSGETFAQIKAEESNPKGDVWWGGTGDPHLQAAEEGLTEPYVSPMRNELNDWAISQATSANDKTIGIYSGALGYGYNTELLAAAGVAIAGRIYSSRNTKVWCKWRTRIRRARPTPHWLPSFSCLVRMRVLNS